MDMHIYQLAPVDRPCAAHRVVMSLHIAVCLQQASVSAADGPHVDEDEMRGHSPLYSRRRKMKHKLEI